MNDDRAALDETCRVRVEHLPLRERDNRLVKLNSSLLRATSLAGIALLTTIGLGSVGRDVKAAPSDASTVAFSSPTGPVTAAKALVKRLGHNAVSSSVIDRNGLLWLATSFQANQGLAGEPDPLVRTGWLT
jgi:hypothetical protein